MTQAVEADYLVVGAGAMGMAFTDALIDHADVRVALVDRRHGPGGHWLNAYPFVRLHQASLFYGVPSTHLGGGRIQQEGPEAGLHERADQPTICAYYADVLDRMTATGKVEFFPGADHLGDGAFTSLETGERFEVSDGCRIVDARYLAPDIPAETPPPFEVADGAHVVPVNDLVSLDASPSQYVVAGSGKTATDAIIWLLQRGVDPDSICWVRPREPWMLNRAKVQPNPVIFLGMVADVMCAAAAARTLPELFERLEDDGIMLRIDRSVTPTMAKSPTLAQWELDLLRTVEHVVRLGHIEAVRRGRIDLTDGSVSLADDALVVHCTAEGTRTPPLVPIWGDDVITLLPIRAGFPCFGAALAGYVEATRDDDAEKNRLCPPSTYGNSLAQWALMNVQGARSVASFRSAPDVRAWSDGLVLNPARLPSATDGSPELGSVLQRVQEHGPAGVEGLARLAGMPVG
jgi:hypothetical protein